MRRRWSSKIRVLSAVIFAGAIAYVGGTLSGLTGQVFTPEDEIAIGQEAARELVDRLGGPLLHPAIDPYVERVGRRLVKRTRASKTPYKFEFHLLRDSETVGAFSLPGGPIFVTLGLLSRLTDEAQLAAVLAHQMGHVMLHHGTAHLVERNLAASRAGDDDGIAARTGDIVREAVAELSELVYGPDAESASDRLQIELMTDAGYDPRGALELRQILASAGTEAPALVRAHPGSGDDLERAALEAAESAAGERGEQRFRESVVGFLAVADAELTQ